MSHVLRFSRSIVPVLAVFALCAPAAGAKSAGGTGPAAAKQVIDNQVIPRVRAYDDKLSVSAATCPDKFDFSGSKAPFCTFTVNNVPIQVNLIYDKSTNQISIQPASFFEFDTVERLEKAMLLNDYGIKADVQCGNPRYRLIPVGTVFTCAVVGDPTVTELRLRADNNGQLFAFNPKGLSSPAWMLNAIAQHDAGKQTILDGPTVAAWIESFVAASSTSDKRSELQVHCPASLDVTGTKHAICILSVQGHDVRREIFVDPVKGVDSRTLDVPVDLAVVQKETQDDLNLRLQRGGLKADGVVRCDTGLIVVTPPSTFYCDALGGGAAYRVEVKVLDTTGTVQWRFISGDTAPSAAPTAPG